MTITSVAALRRAMPKGATVHIENHRYPALSGERTVLRAQTNAWESTFPVGHPRYSTDSGSWLNVPKRDAVTFDGNTATIADKGEPFCTITVE
jgi:hypothetical protein